MSSTLFALKNGEVFSSSICLDHSFVQALPNETNQAVKLSVSTNTFQSVKKNPLNSNASDFFDERGFVYGDGYFDTMRYQGSGVALWSLHRKRILDTVKRLAYTNSDDQYLEFERLVDLSYARACSATAMQAENDGSSFIVKFIVTGGELSVGSYAHPDSIPNIYVLVKALTRAQNTPSSTLRLSLLPLPHNEILSGIKHLSRSNYILSARHALGAECSLKNKHVLFIDTEQHVIETMHHNIFIVEDGVLKTPKLDKVGVNGVMRRWLLDALNSGLYECDEITTFKECELNIDSICRADEVFITNAIDGMLKVDCLEVPSTNGNDFHDTFYDLNRTPVFDALNKIFVKKYE